jgi:hypothetical protein
MLIAMPIEMAYTPNDRAVRLDYVGQPLRRFWRRSRADKTALAYQEAGYRVVVAADEDPPRWSVCELNRTLPRLDYEPS